MPNTPDQPTSSAVPPSSNTPPVSGDDKSLVALIEKNIKWSQVIYEQNRKIQHRLTMMVVGSYLRLALILIPLIIATIYLPPLFETFFDQYRELFSSSDGASATISPDMLRALGSTEVQEFLNRMKQ